MVLHVATLWKEQTAATDCRRRRCLICERVPECLPISGGTDYVAFAGECWGISGSITQHTILVLRAVAFRASAAQDFPVGRVPGMSPEGRTSQAELDDVVEQGP